MVMVKLFQAATMAQSVLGLLPGFRGGQRGPARVRVERSRWRLARRGGLALVVALLCTWAGHGFGVGVALAQGEPLQAEQQKPPRPTASPQRTATGGGTGAAAEERALSAVEVYEQAFRAHEEARRLTGPQRTQRLLSALAGLREAYRLARQEHELLVNIAAALADLDRCAEALEVIARYRERTLNPRLGGLSPRDWVFARAEAEATRLGQPTACGEPLAEQGGPGSEQPAVSGAGIRVGGVQPAATSGWYENPWLYVVIGGGAAAAAGGFLGQAFRERRAARDACQGPAPLLCAPGVDVHQDRAFQWQLASWGAGLTALASGVVAGVLFLKPTAGAERHAQSPASRVWFSGTPTGVEVGFVAAF